MEMKRLNILSASKYIPIAFLIRVQKTQLHFYLICIYRNLFSNLNKVFALLS